MKFKLLLLSVLFSLNVFALGIQGQKAPSFWVDIWLPNGNSSLDIEDYKGKVLYVYDFQANVDDIINYMDV